MMSSKGIKSDKILDPEVALGNNRNNGSNLGAFYVNANNGLANANGNNWRSRLYL